MSRTGSPLGDIIMIPVFVRSEKAANTNAIVFGVTLP
jgi:hypothetical protein